MNISHKNGKDIHEISPLPVLFLIKGVSDIPILL
jgi:hypothetical protein